ITRAMHFGAKVLLLDEPTAALSVRETRNVLQSIGRARDHGIAILYIDHNMSHVLPIADRIVLLELGRIVRVIDRGEVSVEELQDMIAIRNNGTNGITSYLNYEGNRHDDVRPVNVDHTTVHC